MLNEILNQEQHYLVIQAGKETGNCDPKTAVNIKINNLEHVIKELTQLPLEKQNTQRIDELMDISAKYREIANKLRQLKKPSKDGNPS